jgi:excisionase family DNA binding protein
MMTPQPQPRLLRTKQAAAYLGCSPWKLRELVRAEKLPHVALGEGVWRFDVHDLDKLIESNRQLGA